METSIRTIGLKFSTWTLRSMTLRCGFKKPVHESGCIKLADAPSRQPMCGVNHLITYAPPPTIYIHWIGPLPGLPRFDTTLPQLLPGAFVFRLLRRYATPKLSPLVGLT